MAGQKVIVTGAGSGIGRALVVLLAAAGDEVLLVGRTESKLIEVQSLIGSGEIFCIDLNDADAGKKIVEAGVKAFGRIDGVFHVAGDAPMKEIGLYEGSEIDQCLRVNLGVGIEMVAAAWDGFKAQGRGFVGFVSSMASVDPFPGFSVYASAKVGVNMFIKCVATEGESIGVKSVAVGPGAVETPMLRGLFGEDIIGKDQTLSPEKVAGVLMDCYLGDRVFGSGDTIMMPT